jgi:hypothetical protein
MLRRVGWCVVAASAATYMSALGHRYLKPGWFIWTGPDFEFHDVRGITLLAIGWMDFPIAWLSNPLLFLSWVCILKRKWLAALLISAVALLCTFNFTIRVLETADALNRLAGAYFFWLASIVISVVGSAGLAIAGYWEMQRSGRTAKMTI